MTGTPHEPDFTGLEGEGDEAQQAADAVRAVLNWYTARIVAGRRAPVPDEEQIAQWTADREATFADLDRLPHADPAERSRLAELYAARLRELES
ncbi:hypothetical protein [Streptomyces sp. NRRL F-5123]|uniref:hypothetical protein n=1 Tax=Streptomyces sp. NRRL F-5123 TaxID=1463856 RepID=UPI0004E2743A|nr:hypothetical protein [Streptomyces sp. NRRL F-5123]